MVISGSGMTSAQQNQTLTTCKYGTVSRSISCPLGNEIYILGVLYGRTHDVPATVCNAYKVTITNFTCMGGPTASTYVQNQCAAQNKCTISQAAYNGFPDPCPGVPKFLKIDYQCIVPTLAPVTSTVTSSSNVTTTVAMTTTGRTTTPVATTGTQSNPKTYKTTTLAPNVCKYPSRLTSKLLQTAYNLRNPAAFFPEVRYLNDKMKKICTVKK